MATRASRAVKERTLALCAAVLAGRDADARTIATALKAALEAAPKPKRTDEPVPTPGWTWAPPDAPSKLTPDTYVNCAHYSAQLRARLCIERQTARWPGGNRMGDGSVKKKSAGIYPYCSSGCCAQGLEYKTALPGFEPKLAKNPGRIFYRPDVLQQRKARKEFIRSRTDHVPSIDDPPGSADRPPPLDLADPDVRQILDGDVDP